MNVPHPEIERRNQRIACFYLRGVTRKQIAYRLRITYELVRKVLYHGAERRRRPRHHPLV